MKKKSAKNKPARSETNKVAVARAYYAEELRAVANLQSEALVKAFAKVARENFLGTGPWRIFDLGSESYWTTKDADPRHLYHNVLVAIDEARKLNNGQPSALASWFDTLELQKGEDVVHVGCGTGYYTAILAEIVGRKGHITAIEIDPGLASRARSNLKHLNQVQVFTGDGGQLNSGASDAIFINAGVTHPCATWLESLRPGGRLLVPLTVSDDMHSGGGGRFLKVTRHARDFLASFVSEVGIFHCMGARDTELNQQLRDAFNRGDWNAVQSLRREPHKPADTCWFHAETFCLSKLALT